MMAGRADAARRVVTKLLRRSSSTAQLIRHVGVDSLGAGAFLGQSLDLGWGRIYGGQTMAQAVAACQEVAGPGRSLHQFACHFLRGGDVSLGVNIDTTELSSGRSFTCVHARAMQAGRPILAMTASLQTPEAGFGHQPATGLRPEWLTPHDLRPLSEHMRPYLSHLPNDRLRQVRRDHSPAAMCSHCRVRPNPVRASPCCFGSCTPTHTRPSTSGRSSLSAHGTRQNGQRSVRSGCACVARSLTIAPSTSDYSPTCRTGRCSRRVRECETTSAETAARASLQPACFATLHLGHRAFG